MENHEEKESHQKILIISNNPFSKVQHNGKTLASFFESYSPDDIAQLYFNSAAPDNIYFNRYYRISDSALLSSVLHRSKECGGTIDPIESFQTPKSSEIFSKIKNTNLSRIIRDIMWKGQKWNTKELNKWLDDFSPEIVFLLAGDCGFAYDVCKYVSDRYNSKLVVYITDDYILPRFDMSLFFWIRRSYLSKKMKTIVGKSDLFMTISQEMGNTYNKLFGKDSIQAIHISESLYENQGNNNRDMELIELVYAGGLHYHRDRMLGLLAQAIQKHNNNSVGKKAILKIYSTSLPSQNVLNRLNIEGASKFCGGLDSTSVKTVLNNCDIPVHVEAFNKRAIAATRLSISTKIPEYLSLRKCILAIGPKEIASMRYLADCAFCITEKSLISEKIEMLLQDTETQNKYADLSYNKFLQYHEKIAATENFLKKMHEL